MKHLLSILLFLGIYQSLIGQSHSSIDIVIGGETSFRHITGSFADVITIDEALYSDSRTRDTPIINGRLGAFYSQRIGKRHFLKLGFMFSSAGYKQGASDTLNIKDNLYNAICPLRVNVSSLFPAKINRYRFIEFPFMLRLENGSKGVGLFTEIGVSQALYINTKTTSNGRLDNLGDIGVTVFTRNPLIGIISLGVNLNTFAKYQVFAQASFRYFIIDLGASLYREHLYNYGVEIGMRRIIN